MTGAIDTTARPDGLFVAGTGTGVGKTVVTAGLTGWLRTANLDARAIKPAQTGAPEDDDAAFVTEVCGDPSAATCLRSFEPALAPRVAAAEAEQPVSYEALLAECEAAVDEAEVAIVEGIGGLRVPLAGDREVLDLAADLGLPALVVARSGLGTLNHTALSVDALRDRGLPVHGVLLNEYEGDTLAERTNPDELERMLDVPVHTMEPIDPSDSTAIVDAVRSSIPDAVRSSLPDAVGDSPGTDRQSDSPDTRR
jgi:dethiobiotin synthetase